MSIEVLVGKKNIYRADCSGCGCSVHVRTEGVLCAGRRRCVAALEWDKGLCLRWDRGSGYRFTYLTLVREWFLEIFPWGLSTKR